MRRRSGRNRTRVRRPDAGAQDQAAARIGMSTRRGYGIGSQHAGIIQTVSGYRIAHPPGACTV
jgi:hypothetical protein